MTYTDEQRLRIGHEVARKRVSKGLGKEGASKAAAVSSITWKRVEDGKPARDASLGRVLSSLNLDVQQILSTDQKVSDLPPPANTDPPGVLHVATLLWDAVKEAAEAAFEFGAGPEVQRRNVRAVVITADVLTDFLLGGDDALAAKELVMEMFKTVFELRDRLTRGVSDESKAGRVPGGIGAWVGNPADNPRVLRDEEGDERDQRRGG
jgi:hypothetical protein